MLTLLLILLALVLAVGVGLRLWIGGIKKTIAAGKEAAQKTHEERLASLAAIPLANRDADAIYQWSFHHGDRQVGRVVKPQVDEQAKEVRFMEVTHSDLLLLPDECHFRKYKLEIDTVGDAVKIDKIEPAKGRILREVTAQITGYVEQ